MSDDRLERALSDAIADIAGTGAPDYLDDILERTSRTRQRPWWTFPGRYTIMTPTLRFAAAAGLAFVLGLGISPLIMPSGEGGITGPAGVSAPGQTDDPAFPTGTFVSVEDGDRSIEFNAGGDGRVVDGDEGFKLLFTYATNGDVYAELTYDEGAGERPVPATYLWDFDGERLTFELWGEDPLPTRIHMYTDNTWVLVNDPLEVVVTTRDIAAGDTVHASSGRVRVIPSAQVGPDVFTDVRDVSGSIAAVDIAAGQPLTPDLLEPPAE